MEYYTLKDGRNILIRKPLLEDAQKMCDYMDDIAYETNNLLREPGEALISLQNEINHIKRISNSENDTMLNAFDGDELIAIAGYSGRNLNRVKHKVNLGISLRKEYYHLGLGTKLMFLLMDHAKKQGKTKMELNVRKDNENAIALYKKVGFVIEGINKKGIYDHGKYIDLVMMGKEL